jgi:hypothetical protein
MNDMAALSKLICSSWSVEAIPDPVVGAQQLKDHNSAEQAFVRPGQEGKQPRPYQNPQDLTAMSGYAVDYELTVHSNVTLPSHLKPCRCGLCSKQGILVLSKTLGFVVEGCFKAGLPEGEDVQVELQYVIIHELPGGTMPNRAYSEEWVVKQLGAISAAQFCTSVAANQLVSSYQAAIAMKREQPSLRSTIGTFHTYI